MDIVINLKRRPDRLRKFLESARKAGLEDLVVTEAVDGKSSSFEASTHLTDAATAACWLSHVQAYNLQIEESADYAVIFEDDCDFSQVSNWGQFRNEIRQLMQQYEIDILQLGFLEPEYSPIKRVLREVILIMTGQALHAMKPTNGPSYVDNNFGSGAHAYVTSLRGARTLARINNPCFLPADGVLRFIAESQQNYGKIKISRLEQPVIGQLPLSENNKSDIIGRK